MASFTRQVAAPTRLDYCMQLSGYLSETHQIAQTAQIKHSLTGKVTGGETERIYAIQENN